MSTFVISLDFEVFWGVADSRAINEYRKNIEGEWQAIPQMLALFCKYEIKATWATVGMLMCKNFAQWQEIRPSEFPSYFNKQSSTYTFGALAKEYPNLFFARPLVEQILATPGQELATHTYSHFYCDEPGATIEQFEADLACAVEVASIFNVKYSSLVFPRNQVSEEYLPAVKKAGIKVYRGNPKHWLFRDGHVPRGGIAGRAVRLADSWLPLTGPNVGVAGARNGLINVPASLFLRPWSRQMSVLEPFRLNRIKKAMTSAARSDGIFHLWWHPHNFGLNTNQNINALNEILQHFLRLKDIYGMRTARMDDFVNERCE